MQLNTVEEMKEAFYKIRAIQKQLIQESDLLNKMCVAVNRAGTFQEVNEELVRSFGASKTLDWSREIQRNLCLEIGEKICEEKLTVQETKNS